MKKLLLSLLLLSAFGLQAQQGLKLQVDGKADLKLKQLKVDVEILDGYALTTYDMLFYNGLDETLEGELVFPLGENQEVFGFAMELNGSLREAVVVEKELARVAYETTISRRIDPALLEKVQGNNYKARVYPIFPKKNKRIVLTFEQNLQSVQGQYTYELPLGFSKKLDQFQVNMQIQNVSKSDVIFENAGYPSFSSSRTKGNLKAHIKESKIKANQPLLVRFPSSKEGISVSTYQDYFVISQSLEAKRRLKSKPRSIAILWDVSASMAKRNLQDEFDLLKAYFNHLEETEVRLFTFNNDIRTNQVFRITNGQSNALINTLKSQVYDGGTAMHLFEDVDLNAQEVLLFTDGLDNLGSLSGLKNTRLYTLNSSSSADHFKLTEQANSLGGQYLNLVQLTTENALDKLTHHALQFLGIESGISVYDYYPNSPTTIGDEFDLSGRFSARTPITLLYGYGGEVSQRDTLTIEQRGGTAIVKRLWARQKLNALIKNQEANKKAIISHAKSHQLITNYTSMIVLDRIEDYVRYRIEPPKELRQEFKRRIARIDRDKEGESRRLASQKKHMEDGFQELRDWLLAEKKTIELASQTTSAENTTTQRTTPSETNSGTNESPRVTTTRSREGMIQGTVTDADGVPLPGVSILVEGTSNGTQTDFDGNYEIAVVPGDVLRLTYVGQKTLRLNVTQTNVPISTQMEEDSTQLQEVVVVGYGTRRATRRASRRNQRQERRRQLTASVQRVTAESLDNESTADVAQILQGRASGLQVSQESSTPIRIRGTASINASEPLFIIDGVPAEQANVTSLSPENIESMNVLKDQAASALYGSRGRNGVVVIRTKKGMKEQADQIQVLEKEIQEKSKLQSWEENSDYMRRLSSISSNQEAYSEYLALREFHNNRPSFYLDVADFFAQRQQKDQAIKILTNLIEIEIENFELLRALAYKLEYFGEYDLAVSVYQKVLELRPEHPQSYRDLALAYEANQQYQKSFDLLYSIYLGNLLEKDENDRYFGIEQIAYVELCRLANKFKEEIEIPETAMKELQPFKVDVRVVVDWNHNDTDLDLWVEDPFQEVASYKRKKTKIGGRMSHDMTRGFGPEEFMLNKAPKGTYKVSVDYFSDRVQKISGPTILKVTLYKNYGQENEVKEVQVHRLEEDSDEIEVGKVKV